jgi:hypothetical protein
MRLFGRIEPGSGDGPLTGQAGFGFGFGAVDELAEFSFSGD